MKILKAIGVFFLVILGINLITLLMGADSNKPSKLMPTESPSVNTNDFERLGYFKGNKDRVFTISFQLGIAPSSIQAYAKGLPHTHGGMTSAYFYKEGAVIPNDGVTLAKGSISATNVIFDTKGLSSWQYVYMVFRTGEESFIDCIKKPASDLCKK